MRQNTVKQRLAEGRVCVGAGIPIPSPDLVEVAGSAGFDFVTFDAEHGLISDEKICDMVRAAESFSITPIVRVAKNPERIFTSLVAGAQGIHIPRCNSMEDAIALVEWTKHFPNGKRTFYSLGRSANYGVQIDDAGWAQEANSELLLVVMIEEVEGVSALSEILSVPGVDAIHIGPRDLWQSMGMPEEAEVEEAMAHIVAESLAAGKNVSVTLHYDDRIHERIAENVDRGVRMVTIPILDFILSGAAELLGQVRP